MQRLVVATHNPGKLAEFRALLEPFDIDAVAAGQLGIGEPDEPYRTFVENALAKARHASAASGLPALADDSGLCVDVLGGAPGVRSARYAEIAGDADRETRDRANNERLVGALTVFERPDAHFLCCLVLLRHADDPEPIVTFGRWHGTIVAAPRGAGGFGYDAHFLLPDLGITAAELDRATKNRISHRGIALARMADRLRTRDFAMRGTVR